MSKLQFRCLLVFVMVTSILSSLIDFIIPHELTENVLTYASDLEPAWSNEKMIAVSVALIPIIICAIGGFIGLLLFKRWGRTMYVIATITTFPMPLLLGISIYSPLMQIFYDIGLYGEGVILALCYFSPLSKHFEKTIV